MLFNNRCLVIVAVQDLTAALGNLLDGRVGFLDTVLHLERALDRSEDEQGHAVKTLCDSNKMKPQASFIWPPLKSTATRCYIKNFKKDKVNRMSHQKNNQDVKSREEL